MHKTLHPSAKILQVVFADFFLPLLLLVGPYGIATAQKIKNTAGELAPKPLYHDPVHDGAADPTLIWNRACHEWWMFYANRRADLATNDLNDASWVHGTHIGIAVSKDGGAHWTYRGVAAINYGKPDYTRWAPDIVYTNGK
jgi:hypothetical protein